MYKNFCRVLTTICLALATTSCFGQAAEPLDWARIDAFVFGTATPGQPVVNVELYGVWPRKPVGESVWWKMGATEFSVEADSGRWIWAEATTYDIPPIPPAEWRDGEMDGRFVRGIAAGQFDAIISFPAYGFNPFDLWRGRIEFDDFTPRVVTVRTFDHARFVLTYQGRATDMMAIDRFTGGHATIVVRTDCPADLDGDGSLTVFDFIAMQNFFTDASPVADLDADGDLTLFDFLTFQNAVAMGCG